MGTFFKQNGKRKPMVKFQVKLKWQLVKVRRLANLMVTILDRFELGTPRLCHSFYFIKTLKNNYYEIGVCILDFGVTPPNAF